MPGSLTPAQAEKAALVIGLAALIEDRDPKEQAALDWMAAMVDGLRNRVAPNNPRAERVLICRGDHWLEGPRTALTRELEPTPSAHRGCGLCGGQPLVPDPPSRLAVEVRA